MLKIINTGVSLCLLVLNFNIKTIQADQMPLNNEKWLPPTPVFLQQFDWLKLTSGEWLKGDIIVMYDDELEFDSDQFGKQTFDWGDVEELRSRYDQQIRFANGQVKRGFLIISNNHIVLISDGKEEHYPLTELLSISPSAEKRKNLWNGKVSLGIDINRGNTKQLDYSARIKLERSTPYTRLKTDYIFNYSKSTELETDRVISNNTRFSSSIDWFYNKYIFFRVLDYEYLSDLQQNINSRNTLGLSIGYHLFDNKRLAWDITLGPSYQKTDYNLLTDTTDQQSAVIAFASALEYKFSSKINFIVDYQLQFVERESGKRNTFFKALVEFDLSDKFDVDLGFYLDRIASPVKLAESTAVKSNDYKLMISLGYDY
jgi:putative salt-induced outer membrane protein YdiY